MNKIQKRKRLFYTYVIAILFFIMPPFYFCSAGGFEGDIGSIVHEVTEKNIDKIDTTKDVVFAENDKIYYADAAKLFFELKKAYGDEIVERDNGDQVEWSKISSDGDSNDAKNFKKKVAYAGSPGTAMTSTLSSALLFDDNSLDYPIKLSEFVIPIALSIMLANMLMELQERASSEIKSMESLMMIFLKYGIGFAFITCNSLIITEINHAGQYFLNAVNNVGGAPDALEQLYSFTTYSIDGTEKITVGSTRYDYTDSLIEIAQECDTDNVWISILAGSGDFMSSGLTSVFQTLANLWLTVMCYALKITFALRLVTLPAAYADLAANGAKGRGFSYLKGTIGEAMTMGLVLAMCVLSAKIAAGTGGLAVVMLPLSSIGAFNSVKNLAKEAFS